MISILLSWLVIGVYTYLYGHMAISLFYGKEEKVLLTWDIYITFGIVVLTIYAQIFSLFYKVGAIAFVLISVGAVGCAGYLFYTKWSKGIAGSKIKELGTKNIILLIGVLGTLLWTNIIPQHYDTGLYHAQAIRWIEEYGVVPGLGNLHFRLAYNSAFLSLQALFSFVWIVGSSLHTVNGFISAYLLAYAVISFRKEGTENLQVSDLLKISMVIYFLYINMNISSPNTDVPALLLLFYICIKWSEFSESQMKSALPYSFLCVLCVYAVTVKLSVAVFVILVVYPASILIRRGQWGQIRNHIIAGIVLVIPWLIRNVIISGYLIYPYPEIDLFHVDWKMSEQTVLADRREIVAWGRGNYNVARYHETISKWFYEWFMSVHVLWRILFVIAVIAAVILLYMIIQDLFWHRNIPQSILGSVSIGGMMFWLFTAPLPRYGVVYMVFVVCAAMGRLLQYEGIKKCLGSKVYEGINKVANIGILGLIILYSLCLIPYSYLVSCGRQTLLMQNDYQSYDVIEECLEGITISRAATGDQTGYSPFPTTPYLGAIESIELRGNDLGNGFRLKNIETFDD